MALERHGLKRGYPNRIPFKAFTRILESAGLSVSVPENKPFKTVANEVQEATYLLKRKAAH
jgi:hypothetical protein